MYEGVSIIIPTYNGGRIFRDCLSAILKQKYDGLVELIVIDSGSTDGSYEVALEAKAKVRQINQNRFHHSRTRNEAVALAKYPLVVFLVQDAVPVSDNWLCSLVASLNNSGIAAAYGQQIPHSDADLYARFEVEYFREYLGNEAKIQSLESSNELDQLPYDQALRRIRFDNVCAIYRKSLLEKFPFPEVPYGEDIAWAKTVLTHGYRVLYQPSVQVSHSHNRPAEYRFRRAIVESLVCARILNRTRQDLSFINLSDIHEISNKLDLLADKKRNELIDEQSYAKFNTDKTNRVTQFKLPILKHLLWKTINLLPRSSQKAIFIKTYLKIISGHVDFVLSWIKNRYPEAKPEDLQSCVGQIIFTVYGQMLGEVYASYELKGFVKKEIASFVEPFLRGV